MQKVLQTTCILNYEMIPNAGIDIMVCVLLIEVPLSCSNAPTLGPVVVSKGIHVDCLVSRIKHNKPQAPQIPRVRKGPVSATKK